MEISSKWPEKNDKFQIKISLIKKEISIKFAPNLLNMLLYKKKTSLIILFPLV
jgi:hypothetical protein